MADLVQYLGVQAPVSEIINNLDLVYGSMAYFNILMQKFYNLQQGKREKVPVYITHLEGHWMWFSKIPYDVECKWTPEAPDRMSLSWTSQAVAQLHVLPV